ncbi:hypothetical protein LBMAG18_08200 [Alphaproteobacteria bacterium]|nr:hypothetical protein LBMAG18_08200 [Alphaproteobacteria bacterium]
MNIKYSINHKKIFLKTQKTAVFSLIFILLSFQTFIGSNQALGDERKGSSYSKSDFFFEPALSLEYNIPVVSGAGDNKKFTNSEHFFKQVYNLENIAIGTHIRLHESFALNANWVQTNMDSTSLQHREPLAKEAIYKVDHYNFSLQTFLPIIPRFFEFFGETGVAHIRSELAYTTLGNRLILEKSNQSRAFYGVGAQIALNNLTSVRISGQRYVGNFGLISSDYTTVRLGFLRFF